jgi:2-polyprenyl-3-methyl-5-hydroxy-6-metoxy-1,4-benzoquinol methylase
MSKREIRVLDIGCGYNVYPFEASKREDMVVAIDLSKDKIKNGWVIS